MSSYSQLQKQLMEISGKLTSPEILQKGLAVIICIFGTSYLALHHPK